MKKIVLVIIDGLCEVPLAELQGKTPLEAAGTPNLDMLAKEGACGEVEPFWWPKQGYPHSDTTHLALFGYDPNKYYLGRGPYEVAGINMPLKKGDVALRANFATVDENLIIQDRRAGRIEHTQKLIEALQGQTIEGVEFLIKKSYGHRAGLVLRGPGLSSKITDNDPHKAEEKTLDIEPKENNLEAQFTAKILNQFLKKAHQTLKQHPLNQERIKQGQLSANYLLVRGAGQMKETPGFQEKHGLKSACIAGGALYKGIAKILGMDLIEVKGANGLPSTDLKGKFNAACKTLENYDFVFIHIKATDNLAEDGNYLAKKDFIEKIDENIAPLLKLKNTVVAITADHCTCCKLKSHCAGPVPLLISDSQGDGVNSFSEKSCQKGGLAKLEALELMDFLKRER